jgi:hypothetical protein
MAKTYVPSLRFIVTGVHKYATRYQPQLSVSLSPTQYAALLEFIGCCANLLSKLGPGGVNP